MLAQIKEEDISELEIKETLSREELGQQSKKQVEYDQIFGKLQAKATDALRDKEENLNKRKPWRKRYYSSNLKLLESEEFEKAAENYLKLAYDFTKRKDFGNSSLMVTLHGLSLLKTEEPLKSIKDNIDKYLNSLGINKKLVEETFPIMLISFLIDAKLYHFNQYLPKIKEMLNILPLFEEEKILIKLDD